LGQGTYFFIEKRPNVQNKTLILFLFKKRKKQNDTYYVVAMATVLAPVSFYEKPDDDRIVSHDAIFYVRDATSKLSWISA